jgi:hypothetical protein
LKRLTEPVPCRNCGRLREPEQMDRLRWCGVCRQVVVRRAAVWARVAALAISLGVAAWIVLVIRPTRTLVVWMALIAATYLVVSRLTQRIAFEVIRARGVPTEEVPHDHP